MTTRAWAMAYAFSLALGCMPASADDEQEKQAAPTFPPSQVQAIEDIVRAYLLEHPEIIVESVRRLEERDRAAAEQRRQDAVAAKRDALIADPDSPVLGNPSGDVTIVEFFDYNCPYCRGVAEKLRQTVTKDGNIRLVMKEFPILGPDSLTAARAALAAAKQGKYSAFHFALMSRAGNLNEEVVLDVARDLGLDVERLRQDMHDTQIDDILQRNYELAEALEIGGTPAFVVGEALVPGAVDMDALMRLVEEARANSG